MSRLITVIPVYNGARHLAATLEAVARQTVRPDRVIVQDNCSTDGTRQVFEPFAKLGFEWHQNERNIGGTANFNRALMFARETDYLHLIPHDDLIKPRFYERLFSAMESASAPAFGYSAYEVICDDGQLVADGDLACPFPVTATGLAREVSQVRFLKWQADLKTICLPAVLMKTGSRPLPVEFSFEYIQAADAVFYAELAARGYRVFEVTESLCQYRRHAAAYTSSNQRAPGAVVADEWKAMLAIGRLIPQSGPASWFWRQRQQCLLAARSVVKARSLGDPALREDTRQAVFQCVGQLPWVLGYLAVAARDCLRKVRSGNHK